jgi:hypothetical protein
MLALAGCGGSKSAYKDNVSMEELAAVLDEATGDADLIAMQESYLKNAMQLAPEQFADYVVKINAKGVNIDEYGVFKAAAEKDVEAVKAAAEGYLQFRLDTWMREYMPEELPKLENAQVKVCGSYVLYAILSEDAAQAAFDAFEAALKA